MDATYYAIYCNSPGMIAANTAGIAYSFLPVKEQIEEI
jgi:hypothetical protein